MRPVVIMSRDAINATSAVVLAVPCATYRPGRRLYPSQALLRAPDGGLTVDAVALGEQVRALVKTRPLRRRGALSAQAVVAIERGLILAFDLSGQLL